MLSQHPVLSRHAVLPQIGSVLSLPAMLSQRIGTVADEYCGGRIGQRRAPGVNLDCRFDLLLTRGPNWVHRRRWCRAESRYARRNRSEASARCVPRSSFLLAFNTGRDLGARRALLSGRVAICEAEAEIDPVENEQVGWSSVVFFAGF